MAAIVQKLCHTAELFHNVTKYSLTASYKKLYTAWQYKLYRKSPAAPSHPDGKWRVAADQICGTVLISRTNITLPDQANREGFVETPEFSTFTRFSDDRNYY